MEIKKGQWPLVILNFLVYLFSIIYFIAIGNYEFLIYIGVVLLIITVILYSNSKVNYSNFVLWLLSIWGFLHMAGGAIKVNGDVLYTFMIYTFSETYKIFKYDQLVHIFGFFVATYIMWELLRPLLKSKDKNWVRVSIIVVMAGLGLGALNEIVEFFAVVVVPETGVGGYINTSLDLVADLIGGFIALIFILYKEKNKKE